MPDPDSALEQTVCMTGTASPTLVTTVWYMETGMVTSCPETGNARSGGFTRLIISLHFYKRARRVRGVCVCVGALVRRGVEQAPSELLVCLSVLDRIVGLCVSKRG